MAVRKADVAIDEWITNKIDALDNMMASQLAMPTMPIQEYLQHMAYRSALIDVQQQLHEFWGASLE